MTKSDTSSPSQQLAPLSERQIDAAMSVIEERLAVIWARPGSREFFAHELRLIGRSATEADHAL